MPLEGAMGEAMGEAIMAVEGSTKAFVFEAYLLERASWRPPSKRAKSW